MSEPVVLQWSGGKDSALALEALTNDPDADVVGPLFAWPVDVRLGEIVSSNGHCYQDLIPGA